MEEEVKEIAECSICFDLFTDPRILPCIHTFCLKCLNEALMKAKLKPGDSMSCPLCRTPFVIPDGGIAGLKRNFFMERLVEISKLSKPSDNKIFCENCIEGNEGEATEKPTATRYCINCSKNICDRCYKEHKKYQELKEHQLVAVGSLLKDELMKKLSIQNCERHNKEPVKHYCLDCQKVICMTCYVEEHNSHKCSNFDKMGDTFREELKNDIEQLGHLHRDASEKIITIAKEQQDFIDRVEFVKHTITKRSELIKQFVDKCTNSLLVELSSIRNQETKRLETSKEENEQHKMAVKSLELYLKEFLSKGSPAEICRSARFFHNRCENLVKDHIKQNERRIVSMDVSFNDSNSVNLETEVNIVGAIETKEKTKCEEIQNDDLCVDIRSSIELDLSAADSRSIIRGVTKLGRKILVVCYKKSSILVFNEQSPFHFQKKVKTREIAYPYDIAAIEKSKCLFISDGFNEHLKQGNRCIWKVTGDDYRVTKWLINVDKPYKISSSPDGHLLILRQTESINRLEIYTPKRKLIRGLSLPADVLEPFCCIQTFNGEFIISHRDGKTNRWTISLLSNNGQEITRQFQPRNVLHELSGPSCLFQDGVGDLLFAADYGNASVYQLNKSSLQPRKILQKETGLWGLFCDSPKQQLFVQYGERVVVYFFDYV